MVWEIRNYRFNYVEHSKETEIGMIPAELQKIVDKNGCLIDHHSISYKNIWIADFYSVDSNDSSLYHVAFMYFDKDDVPKISENNYINWYLSTVEKRTIKQIDKKLNELVQIVKNLEIKRKFNRIEKDF